MTCEDETHRIESDRLSFSAWVNQRILRERLQPPLSKERRLAWEQEWRHFNPYDSRRIPQPSYAFPKGFLEGTGAIASAGSGQEAFYREFPRPERSDLRHPGIREGDFRRAAEEIVRWARTENRCFPCELRDLTGAAGQEFDVLLMEGRVLKFTKRDEAGKIVEIQGSKGSPGLRAAWPWEFLERIRLANTVFQDDIRLEGISIGRFGEISLVISQPTLLGVAPTRAEIISAMHGLGFGRIHDWKSPGSMEFYHRQTNIAVFDAYPHNLLKDSEGKVMPFDVLLVRPENEVFISWLQAHSS